jgi:hypothetical protein
MLTEDAASVLYLLAEAWSHKGEEVELPDDSERLPLASQTSSLAYALLTDANAQIRAATVGLVNSYEVIDTIVREVEVEPTITDPTALYEFVSNTVRESNPELTPDDVFNCTLSLLQGNVYLRQDEAPLNLEHRDDREYEACQLAIQNLNSYLEEQEKAESGTDPDSEG